MTGSGGTTALTSPPLCAKKCCANRVSRNRPLADRDLGRIGFFGRFLVGRCLDQVPGAEGLTPGGEHCGESDQRSSEKAKPGQGRHGRSSQ
jgi:hypothetical protein